MNIPLIHEVITSFQSLGDAITGDTDRARERWDHYAKESIVGSSVASCVARAKGNDTEARELAGGLARAFAKAVTLHGLGGTLPILHELATCGESLGDVMAAGDLEAARARWDVYKERSVLGSGVCAAVEAGRGNLERARGYGVGMGKAAGGAAVNLVVVAASVATAGAAAPLGVGLGAALGAVVGSGLGVGGVAATAAINGDGKNLTAGDLVGAGLLGGALGAVGGALRGKVHTGELAAVDVAEIELALRAYLQSEGELVIKARSSSLEENVIKRELLMMPFKATPMTDDEQDAELGLKGVSGGEFQLDVVTEGAEDEQDEMAYTADIEVSAFDDFEVRIPSCAASESEASHHAISEALFATPTTASAASSHVAEQQPTASGPPVGSVSALRVPNTPELYWEADSEDDEPIRSGDAEPRENLSDDGVISGSEVSDADRVLVVASDGDIGDNNKGSDSDWSDVGR
ncbi:hypothetical protein HK101_007522 [Irineochytrium annulatum]|nr:hypothetical protein HK101_007522 [Irineochytrium annulatum]